MAKSRRNANVKLLGVVRRRRPALLVSTALCATVTMVISLPAAAGQLASNASPTGGVVVGGNASISQSVTPTTSQTTVNQSTQRAAVDWQTFNVGSQAQVQFVQPSSSSVTLNQVVGPNPSQIAGKIDANGQIIIENQSGVMFYKGSQVNTAGLMVSAATSSNGAMQAFVNGGNLVMDQAANPNARIVNRGHITIRQAGLAALVAPQVVNSGVITARLGHVVLAGATRTTLDLYGDGMMSIDVTGQVATLPNGATALVTNSGIIVADGGTVQLTAHAVDGLVTTLVDAGGKIQANSLGGHVGTVTLTGVGGGITVEGQLDAMGKAPGTTGGSIEVNATGNVTVASAARINASGQAGGGLIAIGTTLKRAAGGPGVITKHTAANVTVQQGATIAANATYNGNGGRVTVLSTGTTTMNGTISATGGPLGGNGGFVEWSGGSDTSTTGRIDVSAPFGNSGTILLDPDDLDIVASGGNLDGSFSGTVTTGQDGTSTDSLSGSVLDGFTGNVLLQAKLTIDVQSSFSLTAGSLTMEAGQLIDIEPGVNVGASSDIILATGGAGPGTPPAAQPTPVIIVDGSLASSGGSVSLLAGPGGEIAIGNPGLVQAANGKSITLQSDSLFLGAGKLLASGGTIEIAPATAGNAMDFSATGTTTLTVPTLQAGSVVASTLRLGAVTIGGTQTTTAGSITVDTAVNLTGVASTLDVETTGTVSQTSSGTLTAGTLTGNATGGLLLNQVANHIGTVGSFNGGSIFALINTGGLTVAGPVVATGIQIQNDSNATMSVTGSLGATDLINLSTQGTLSVGAGGILNSPSVTLSGAAGITLTGSAVVGQTGGTVDLSATAGNIIEANTGTIIAATLQSSSGVSGTADLLGTANAIGGIGSFAVTGGNFLLTDTTALNVNGTLSAGGSIYLQTSNGFPGISIESGATVAAGSSSLVSFQTDRFINNGTVTGGTFELAPNTSGNPVSLGGDGDLPSLDGIGATSVRIGAVTVPGTGLTTTAGSIVLDGTFGVSTVALELDSNGGIDGSSYALTASTLSGSAATTTSGDANFSATNVITTLGNFVVGGTASSGNFNLVNSGSIAVTGSVSAANVTINADTIGINGGSIVTPGTGSLGLTSTVGAIALTGTALLNGGTVDLASATGIAQSSASTIIATDLTASATNGGIVLGSLTNAIGAVTGMSATGGGVTLVVDPTMVLTGPITGDDLFFEVAHLGGTLEIGNTATGATLSATAASNPTISFVADNVTEGTATSTITATDGSNGGTVEIAPFTSSTAVFLGVTSSASGLGVDTTLLGDIDTNGDGLLRIGEYTGTVTAGNISIAGAVNLGTVAATTLELDSASGSITEAGSIALSVATLTGTAVGNVTLFGTDNAIGTLGSFVTAGNFALVDNAATLNVTGPVQSTGTGGSVFLETTVGGTLDIIGSVVANNGTIGLISDTPIAGSGAVIDAGTSGIVELAPRSPGSELVLSGGSLLAAITAAELRVGAYHDVANGGTYVVSAASIDIAASFSLATVPLLELDSTGSITELASVALAVTTLTGTAGAAGLLGTGNAIGTLGVFNTASGFALVDNEALLVDGPVTDTGASSTLALTTLTGGITLAGNVSATNLLDLTSAGTISQTSGSISALTLTGSATSAGLTQATNLVGTLGMFSTTAGFALTDDEALTVTGPVTDTGASSTLALTTRTGGITLDGTLSATNVLDLVSAGTISQPGGSIAAGTLTGSATSASLTQPTNLVGTLGAFSTTAGFALMDNEALLVNGPVSDTGASSTLALTTLIGGITLAGNVSATNLLDLTSAGTISQISGSITAVTLTGSATSAGLTQTTNLVGTLGAFNTTAGFALTDNEALLVNGPVIDTGASSTLALTTMTGGITLAGSVSATNVLDLVSAGSIDQTSGSISAGTLTGSAAALVSLLVSTNVVGTLGAFTVTGGDLLFVDNSNLTIAGTVSANDIFAKIDLAGGTLTLGDSTIGATMTASGTVSLVADNITEGSATSTITASDRGVGGTVAIAPFSSGTPVSLGGSPATGTGTLVADGTLLADVSTGTSGTLQIGSYNDAANGGAGTITAGNISVDGAVSLTGGQAGTLLLDSLGSVSESGSNGIQVATLVGSVVAGVTLANSNTIATLGSFIAGGTFDLVDSGAPSLAVTGPVTAAGVTITGAGTTTVTGAVTGTSASNVFVSSGSIALGAGGVLSGGTVDIDSSAGGIAESSGGSIIAATLLSSLGSTGNVDLGDANSVGTLASFIVSGGTFHLDNGGTVGLLVDGPVIGSSVTLDNVAGTLAVNGTILGGSIVASSTFATGLVSLTGIGTTSAIDLNNGAAVNGATIELNAGSVVMSGSASLGNTLALIDVTTTGGGVTEAGTATILAATLQELGTIDGSVTLPGTNNTIAAIGSLAVANGGTFSLTDNGNLGVGTLTASIITIGDAGTLTVTDSLVATTAVSLTADTILIPGEVSDGGLGTTSLIATTGSIVEVGTLIAGTLSGSSIGETGLTGTNQVNNLGSFTATGGFVLDDGSALLVAGPVNGGASATIFDTHALTVNGSVYSTSIISLTGSSIAISGAGYVSDGGSGSSTTSLVATNGSISETGTLIAGTLTGSSTGATSLTGATTITNQLLNLGSFTAAGFVLNDGEALAVAGPVNGGTGASIFDAQALTVNGSVYSTGAISLTGSSIAITGAGYVSDGGAGTTSLIATNGTINETGTLIAGTLSGSASNGGTVSTAANLAGASAIANHVGTLGSFIASSFNLNDGTSLAVNGRLGDDTSVTIALPSSAALTINGTMIPFVLSGTVPSATNVSLTAGSITIPGTVSDGGAGTTSLIATNGSIGETGTLIAGALSGSSTGATSLTGATAITNQVGTLGSFAAASFVLDDGAALTVAGPVNGGTSATILDAQALTVNGSVYSTSVIGLTGSGIAITGAGYVSDGGSGTTSLIATNGTINETGTLIAGTLSGSSTGATNLAGATTTTNHVANLASFSASEFTLDDGIALVVAGPVNGGSSATILDAAALTVNGSVVSTSAISLTGSSIAITGTGYVSDGGAGTTSLIATNGTISETGTLIAGTLSGSSTGATSLAGATTTINQVANLGNFSADGFLLNDGIALAVAGPVNGGTSATILDAAALTVNGSVYSTSAISLTGSSIAINGSGYVSDGGAGTTSLIATLFSSNGTINEIGTLIAGTLSGSSTGTTNLAGATATTNQVANLGSFSASFGNFILDDGTSLTVDGPVSGSIVSIADTGGVTNNSVIFSFGSTSISATGSITNNGTIGEAGGNVILSAGSNITNNLLISGLQNGTLSAGADISNNGSIGFGGNATLIAVGSINDASDGVITAGGVTGVGPTVLLVAQTGSISEASGGTIAATNPFADNADVQLTAQSTTNGNIVVAGAITASGSLGVVGLTAGGSITQTGGSIVAGGPGTIVSGTLAPSISLVAQTGTIGQSAGALISATNAAGAILLAAPGNITFAGTISAPGTASIASLASGATIAETAATGILQAGTLIGSAGNGATLTATSGTGNLVANLGSFATGTAGAGNFVLVDEENLTVIAPVTASDGSVAITATHFGTLAPSNLTNDSTITASSSVTLLADNDITNNDPVIAQGGTVSLTASAGALTNNATVQASTSATLTAGTDITNNNPVIAQGGTVSLIASTGALTNNDIVLASTSATLSAGTDITNNSSVIAQGGTVSLTASTGTLTNNDIVLASTSATLTAGTDITNNGSVIAQTGSASLTATVGMLSNTGLIHANTSATLQAGTDLNNTGSVVAQTSNASLTASTGTLTTSGLILASTSVTLLGDTGLSNTGSVIAQTGNATLTATAGTLFNSDLVRAGSGVFLTAGGDLTTSGSTIAQDGDAVLDAGGALTNSGLVQASASVSMQSVAGLTNTNTGSVIAQTSFASLTSTGGALANAGMILASTNATLAAATNITNTGSVIAQTGSASLTATAGMLSNTGLIHANTSTTLQADTGLSNTGSVIAQTSNASLTASAGTLANAGLILASTSVTLLGDTGLSNTGSVIAQTGNATLTATVGTLFNSGLISAAAANAVVALTANGGPIIQSGSGAGMIAGGSVVLNASGGITLNGLVSDDLEVILNAGGAISQNGTLIADLLTGSAGGTVDLAGATATANQVANLGSFTAGGTFTLNDGINLTISGLVSAANIIINDGSNTISLGNGGFDTDGADRPPGALTALQLPPNAITTLGAYLAAGSVIQTGSSFTVDNTYSGVESILSITLPASGNGTLLFSSGGLVAPNTWLILSVGNGTAGGPIDVAALDFAYNPPPDSANFTGLVDGFSGAAAAGAAFIQPQPNPSFRVDGCPIHSVNCELLATEGVPAAPPLGEINVGAPLNQENPEDLVLPVVSDEQYELVPCDDPTKAEGCAAVAKPPPLH